MKRRNCFSCCTDKDPAVDSTDAIETSELNGGGRVSHDTSDEDAPTNKFIRLAPDNPWLVCRSPDHGGKLFWMHEKTQETTWRQPLPRLAPLQLEGVSPTFCQQAYSVVDAHFFGA